MANEDKPVTVTCIFPNAELAESFMQWMDNMGEQLYDDQLIVDDLPRLITAYNYETRTVEFDIADKDDDEPYDSAAYFEGHPHSIEFCHYCYTAQRIDALDE